jgi:hypothetical protein
MVSPQKEITCTNNTTCPYCALGFGFLLCYFITFLRDSMYVEWNGSFEKRVPVPLFTLKKCVSTNYIMILMFIIGPKLKKSWNSLRVKNQFCVLLSLFRNFYDIDFFREIEVKRLERVDVIDCSVRIPKKIDTWCLCNKLPMCPFPE